MTAIRQAFRKAWGLSDDTPLADVVFASLCRPYKPSRDTQRGWSTNLSFRTYNALKNQGVLA